MQSQALIPRWRSRNPGSPSVEWFFLLTLVLLLSILAQVSIPLSGSPVPITGQTFGLTLIALLSGWARSGAVMAAYLAFGLAGLPVFADAGTGSDVAASFGYLIGMAAAAIVMGYFADRGAAGSFTKSLATALLGAAIIFAFGVAGLSLFVPGNALLSAGVLPFVPGAMIKSILAAAIVRWLSRRFE
jgi:biotin transport system substrate-specific component